MNENTGKAGWVYWNFKMKEAGACGEWKRKHHQGDKSYYIEQDTGWIHLREQIYHNSLL